MLCDFLRVETVDDIIFIDDLPPKSCEAFIDDHVWPVLSDEILKMAMQFLLTYATGLPDNEVFLFKPSA